MTLVSTTACGGSDGGAESGAAEQSAATSVGAELPEPGLVAPGEVDALVAAGVTVVDVRTPDEYAEGHIEGSLLIDFYEPDFAEQIAQLDTDGEYLLYCRSGNRSGQTASLMDDLGFDTVFDLDGGVIAYDTAGLPLER